MKKIIISSLFLSSIFLISCMTAPSCEEKLIKREFDVLLVGNSTKIITPYLTKDATPYIEGSRGTYRLVVDLQCTINHDSLEFYGLRHHGMISDGRYTILDGAIDFKEL